MSNEDHLLTGDFDFAEYSLKVLADKLEDIIELSTGNWLIIWCIFGLFMISDYIDLVTESQTMFLAGSSIFACYMSCIAILMFQNKAHHIRSELVHPLHLSAAHDYRKKADAVRSGFTTAIGKYFKRREQASRIWKAL